MVVMFKQTQHQYTCTLMLVAAALLVACTVPVCRADDYDDEGYGNQGGGAGGDGGGGGGGSSSAGNSNQVSDNDNYQNGYGNDDGYSGGMPNYQQQNVDSDSSNNSPSNYSPQSGSDADGDYEGDDGSAAAAAAASSPEPSVVRIKRAAGDNNEALLIKSSEPSKDLAVEESVVPKLRAKRHAKYYIGPVYTYVKTDKHANFKWGVKHKVGKKHYG